MTFAASVIRGDRPAGVTTEPEIQVQGRDQVVANIPGITVMTGP